MALTTTSSPDGTLVALHVPSPPTHGATTRHTVRLYDAAVTRGLKTTLVASVDSVDGPIVELALEATSSASASAGGASASSSASSTTTQQPPGFLAARLSSSSNNGSSGGRSHPDKIIVWDLHRGVVACTLSSPPACSYCAIGLSDGRLYALTANHDTGKIVVFVHDVGVTGAGTGAAGGGGGSGGEIGKLRRKIKCSSVDVDELSTLKLGMAISITNDGTTTTTISGAADDDDDNDGAGGSSSIKLAIRLGDSVRILDAASGQKLGKKCKVRDTAAASSGSSGTTSAAGTTPVMFSSDAALVATATASGLAVYSVSEGGKALYTIKSHEGPISSATVRNIEGGKYAFLTVEPSGGRAYLSEGTAASSSKTGKKSKKHNDLNTLATLKCASHDSGVVEATFHPVSPGGKVVIMTMPTAAAAAGGAASPLQGGGGAAINEASYRDEDGNMIKGDITVGSSTDEDDADEEDGNKKKRKSALPSGQLVLGPGEGGSEALNVTDRSNKRAKVDEDKSDDDDDDDDGFVLPDDDAIEEAAGGTIAERLAMLTSEMERDDTDDDDDVSEDEDARAALFGGVKGKKKVKPTSESLATLLRQALSSNDDGQLEVALHVSDKKVIENSISALAKDDEIAEAEDDESKGGMIIALLSKLVIRLARKPGRAEELSVWIRTVLLALISSTSGGKRMSKTERDIASRLAPLRNLLNERVESLPHLLRLEGRLSLLGQQL